MNERETRKSGRDILIGATGAVIAGLIVAAAEGIFGALSALLGPPVPPGAVVSFELDSCPTNLGWHEYTQAQGMFIRGHDPNGERKLGTPQEDSIRKHHHVFQGGGAAGTTSADEGGDRQGLWHGGDSGQTGNRPTTAVGGDETRPMNIALLYCVKRGR